MYIQKSLTLGYTIQVLNLFNSLIFQCGINPPFRAVWAKIKRFYKIENGQNTAFILNISLYIYIYRRTHPTHLIWAGLNLLTSMENKKKNLNYFFTSMENRKKKKEDKV